MLFRSIPKGIKLHSNKRTGVIHSRKVDRKANCPGKCAVDIGDNRRKTEECNSIAVDWYVLGINDKGEMGSEVREVLRNIVLEVQRFEI